MLVLSAARVGPRVSPCHYFTDMLCLWWSSGGSKMRCLASGPSGDMEESLGEWPGMVTMPAIKLP